MPAGNTYEAIATQTLGSAAASVTFSSIPSTYTDLVLIVYMAPSGTNTNGANIYFNGDSGAHYSNTVLLGTGSAANSYRYSNTSSIYGVVTSTSTTMSQIFNIQNYANTTTYKTVLSRSNDSAGYVQANVGMWRGSTGSSTDAITSVTISFQGNVPIGSSASLYGIKAA